jgi:large subunit ribosomal protein L6
MSRIGKIPVVIPAGVKASVTAEGLVLIEGPKGKMSYKPSRFIGVVVKDGALVVTPLKMEERQCKADFGTTRARLNTMVIGVSTGWKKTLELNGVGFAVKVAGQKITLSVGFSHDVNLEIPKEIKATVEKGTILHLESADKEVLGTWASRIRDVQPPEPYLGKGIKYSDETIRRKAGKTGKK